MTKKESHRNASRRYYKNNTAKCNEASRKVSRKWYAVNREYSSACKKQWRKNNPDKVRAEARRQSLRIKNNLNKRILSRLRVRLGHAMRGQLKADKTLKLLGCSIENLKIYLESKFDSGMTWANYGKGWHIDHIMPCALFDLSKPENQRRCFHFSNLQPMWAALNISKGSKYLIVDTRCSPWIERLPK